MLKTSLDMRRELFWVDSNGYLQINPHVAQEEVLKLWVWGNYDPAEYEVVPNQILMSAGTGGGKTAFGILLSYFMMGVVHKQYGVPGKMIIMGPDYKRLEGIIGEEFRYWFGDVFGLGDWQGQPRLWFRVHEEPYNGTVFYFRNASDPHSIEGIHAHFVWCDEIGFYTPQTKITEKSYRVMLDRLRRNKGKLLMTTTPYKANWVKTKIVRQGRILKFVVDMDKALEIYEEYGWLPPNVLQARNAVKRIWEKRDGDPNILTIMFPSILNPTYDFSGLLRAKDEWDPIQYQMRFFGEWMDTGERILYQFDDEKHVISPFKIPDGWEAYLGVDFGVDEPFAAVWVVRNPENGKWFVVYEYQQPGIDNIKHAQAIALITKTLQKKINFPEKFTKAYSDPSGGMRRDDTRQNMVDLQRALNERGIDITFSAAYQQLMGGVSILNNLLAHDKLFITDNCTNLLEQAYEWSELGSKHGKEHTWDATRYVIATEERTRIQLERRNKKDEEENFDASKPMSWREYVERYNEIMGIKPKRRRYVVG